MLTGVTLTGADDGIKPYDLLELSIKFPFVEWGILYDGIRSRRRFPSWGWLAKLNAVYNTSVNHTKMNLSLHLCDSALKSLIETGQCVERVHTAEGCFDKCMFSRIQLNFHGVKTKISHLLTYNSYNDDNNQNKEIIVQLDNVNDFVLSVLLYDKFNASGLYDMSHGAGIKPNKWPIPNPNWKVGYAGGLGPDNVVEEVRKIKTIVGEQDFWIDMETNLRTEIRIGDVFDLDKCYKVLSALSHEFKELKSK